MASIQSVIEDVKDGVQDSAHRLEGRAAIQTSKAFVRQQQQMMALLTDQQKELREIRQELQKVRKQRKSGGGFPWGLALLAGAAYALYRSNAGVREQIDSLLGRVDPGIKGNLTRAGDAVKDAASDVMDGKNPDDAAKRAGGEVRRAGEKAVDGVKDAAADVKQDAQAGSKS